jgi:hypothetical protein
VLGLVGGTALLALAGRVASLLVRDRAAAVAGRRRPPVRVLADRIADVVLVCGLDGTIKGQPGQHPVRLRRGRPGRAPLPARAARRTW